MAESDGNGNGNGSKRSAILGPGNLFTAATVVGILGLAVGGTWWVAAKTSEYDRDIATMNAAIVQMNQRISDVRAECFERVRIEHEVDYWTTKNQWDRFGDRNRDLVLPNIEFRPLPGDSR